jgi:hypothetical protein
VEQGVAFRGCARNAGSGGSETARRALRPVLPGAGCTSFGGNAEGGNADPRPKIATVWSAERRGVPIARDVGAPRKRPGPPRDASRKCLCDAAGHRCLASTALHSKIKALAAKLGTMGSRDIKGLSPICKTAQLRFRTIQDPPKDLPARLQ